MGYPFGVAFTTGQPGARICVFHNTASALGLGPEDLDHRKLPKLRSIVDAKQAALFLNWLAYGPNPRVVVDYLHGYSRAS